MGDTILPEPSDDDSDQMSTKTGELQIAGHEVDAVSRHQRLVIELDSRRFHTTPRAFEQDRDRDADLLNAGFSTLRITDHRLKQHPTTEAQRLKRILSPD